MRTDPANFAALNKRLTREPRYYIKIALALNYYFTSHNDVDLPSDATSSNTFHGSIVKVNSTAQALNTIKALSSIGGGTVEILDTNGLVSAWLAARWSAEEALKGKQFLTYVGEKGLANADYALISTHIKSGHDFDGVKYTFHLEDLQRSTKKDIFVLQTTTLVQNVTVDQVAIPVTSTSGFALNWHDTNHTHLPSQYAGYISLKPSDNKEIISWTGKVGTEIGATGTDLSFANADSSLNSVSTDLSVFAAGQFLTISGSTANDGDYIVNTATSTKVTLLDLTGAATTITTGAAGPTVTATAPVQFYNCARGVLNTRAQLYEVDATISADRREKVTEHTYMETDVLNIAYALLTGVWLGTAYTCPWSLSIDTSLINSTSFTQYPDLSSKVLRFSGEKQIDGKKFIAEQLCLPFALYLRVLNDGDLAMRRATGVLSDAAYVAHLTEDDIKSIGTLRYDDKDIYNEFSIAWNWEDSKEETTRINVLEDAVSIAKFGYGEKPLEVEFRGLHGSASTLQDIYNSFNAVRDRYAGPPLKWQIQCLYKHNALEIGDIIRVTLDNVYDATNRVTTGVDRSFEIQGKTVDWMTGNVTLTLFGSTEKSGELSSTTSPTVLSNTFYTQGTALNTQVTIAANHMTVNGSLTGNDDGAMAEFYHGADLTIDAGVTLSASKNIRLYVKGFVTINGTIDLSSAGTATGAGALGTTKSGGGIDARVAAVPPFSKPIITLTTLANSNVNQGVYDSIPFFNLLPDSAGDTLTGLPANLQGSAGPDGGTNTVYSVADSSGGTGAAGGGGLIIVCRGISAGINGKIITSGGTGGAGGTTTVSVTGTYSTTTYLTAGAGGGGAPGGVLILIDGNDYSSTLSEDNFEQYLGDAPISGRAALNQTYNGQDINGQTFSNYYDQGYGTLNQNRSFWRVQYVPDTTAAVADASDTATTATSLAQTPTLNSPQTVGQNLQTVQIDVTAPSDTNYAYSNIYYKLTTDTDYTFVGPARNSVLLPPMVMDGTAYDVIAKPVSVKGVESTDFTHTTVTTSTSAGYVTMGSGNHVKAGQTAYDTGTGFYLGDDGGTPKFSIGNSAANKLTWNGSTLAIVGSVTATIGTIGGWTLAATSLTSGSGGTTVGLDSGGANPAIYAGSATPTSAPFRVTNAGVLTATSGTIGGWTLSSTTLTSTNIGLDASNQKIYIGGSTFGTAGVQMVYTGGSGEIYVGDGANNFFKYTSSTGVLVGEEVLIRSADSYDSDNLYVSSASQNLNWIETLSGTGTAILDVDGYNYRRITVDSNGDYVVMNYSHSYTFNSQTYSTNFKSKMFVETPGSAYADLYLGKSGYTDNNTIVFFINHSDGHLYVRTSSSGGTTETTDCGALTTAGNTYVFEYVFTAGTNVKFYLDGSLIATHSTYIPSGSTNNQLFHVKVEAFTGIAGTTYTRVGDVKFLQYA